MEKDYNLVRISINLNEIEQIKIRYFKKCKMAEDIGNRMAVSCAEYGLTDYIELKKINTVNTIGMKGVAWVYEKDFNESSKNKYIHEIVEIIKGRIEIREQKLLDGLTKVEEEFEKIDEFIESLKK